MKKGLIDKGLLVGAFLAILVIFISPGVAQAQVAQGKEAAGKASSNSLTDTELKQLAWKEVTLTDTWLAANGYSQTLKNEILKNPIFPVYEKDGLYYYRKDNRLVDAEKIPGIEMAIKELMRTKKNPPVRK